MSEIHNDNPETKSSAPEVSQPEPAKASEGDKEKLTPQENDAAKSNRDNNENKKDTDSPEHPKLENNENANQPQVEEKNNTERPEHGKLSPSDPGSATNPEQHPNSEDDEPKKDEGDQPKKSEGDEPKKDEGDQPKKSEDDEPKKDEDDQPKKSESDEPKKDEGDQPKKSEDDEPKKVEDDQPKKSESDEPKKDEGGQPKKSEGDEPKKNEGDQPKKSEDDEPKKNEGDQPKKSESDEPKKDEDDQPKKSEGDEPKKDEDDQPKKSENDESKRNESDDPKANELSPYAKEKLDNFPKDAPEEIKPAYERACAAEPKITNDMKDVTANAPGAHLEGLDYRLKDGDSFARKANSVSENKGIPLEDAANNMHDLNRYTQVSDGDHLVDNANNTLAGLKDKGYTINDVNSTWGDDGAYKGINCKLTSPDGQPCELQFHTPESLDTKEPMHKLYEAQRQLPEGSPEWNAYEDQMRNMSSSLTPPKNIDNLRTNYD